MTADIIYDPFSGPKDGREGRVHCRSISRYNVSHRRRQLALSIKFDSPWHLSRINPRSDSRVGDYSCTSRRLYHCS